MVAQVLMTAHGADAVCSAMAASCCGTQVQVNSHGRVHRSAAVVAQVLVDAYGADAVRFYFLAQLEFGKDGDFNEERFRDKVRRMWSV